MLLDMQLVDGQRRATRAGLPGFQAGGQPSPQTRTQSPPPPPPRSCGQDVLLLLRANTKHNLNTWGLPGGNAELGDTSLLDTGEPTGGAGGVSAALDWRVPP